jgi:hypothetical protein
VRNVVIKPTGVESHKACSSIIFKTSLLKCRGDIIIDTGCAMTMLFAETILALMTVLQRKDMRQIK